MILIDALYINTGGAKVILESIIFQLNKERNISDYFFLFDDRLSSESYSILDKKNFFVINAKFSKRKYFYINNLKSFHKIICLANVPPPIPIIHKSVYILFHNAHIIQPNLKLDKFFAILKYKLKWFYLLYNNRPSYNWIVQTKTMYNLLNRGLFVKKSKIVILPFFNDENFININDVKKSEEICFAYIADGQIQKNHLFLLKAWKVLFESYNINYRLILTVSNSYPDLLFQIDKLQKAGLNIENLGLVPHSDILTIYTKINYLIYPSLIESFGLPLIEATSLGCDVIAIEKEYVTDIIKPSRTFSEYRFMDLVESILDIYKGVELPKTTICINNKMKEFIELIA